MLLCSGLKWVFHQIQSELCPFFFCTKMVVVQPSTVKSAAYTYFLHVTSLALFICTKQTQSNLVHLQVSLFHVVGQNCQLQVLHSRDKLLVAFPTALKNLFLCTCFHMKIDFSAVSRACLQRLEERGPRKSQANKAVGRQSCFWQKPPLVFLTSQPNRVSFPGILSVTLSLKSTPPDPTILGKTALKRNTIGSISR